MFFMNDELRDCDDIGRFAMPQGRFAPIWSEFRYTEVVDFRRPDRLQYRHFSNQGMFFLLFLYVYLDETNSDSENSNVDKFAKGSGTHCC